MIFLLFVNLYTKQKSGKVKLHLKIEIAFKNFIIIN